MIYAYKELVHRITGFHENIRYFFEQLFVHAPADFDENLLLLPNFIPIVNASHTSLRENLENITTVFYQLSEEEQTIAMQSFDANSGIKELCDNVQINPIKYDELPESIRELLTSVLTIFWESYPQNQLLENMCGTVQEHFKDFVRPSHQRALICPFCGLNKLKTFESINRDAYDHYIPKAFYPFISINYRNLFPICYECNSDEKKGTDTLYNGTGRRQVFYPFDTAYEPDLLTITITPSQQYNPANFKTLLYDITWNYAISIAGNSDPRLTSWDDIFHIKRRYRENVLRYQTEWYEEVLRIFKREQAKGTAFNKFRDDLIEDAEYMKLIAPFGMLRHSYFSFLFSIPDFEMKLNETVQN